MKAETLILALVFSSHLLVLYLSWQNQWSIVPLRWLLRITLSYMTVYFLLQVVEELQDGPRIQIVLISALSLVLSLAVWKSHHPMFVWVIFSFHFLILGAGAIWFAFFFRITRLF